MQELLHGASIAFVLKVLAAGLAFALNVVLARLLGAEGSGIFFLTLTIVTIVAAIGRVGMENALVRFIAANIASEQPNKVLGIYQKAMLFSLVVSSILSIFIYLLSPWISDVIFAKPELIRPLSIMTIGVVPLALLTLHAKALQGLKRIAASVSILSICVPLLTCVVAILFVPNYGIDASVWGYIFAVTMTFLFGWRFWKKATLLFKNNSPEFSSGELLTTSMPLFGIVVMNMFITLSPILFLGVWESSENVGVYNAASRTAMLTSFVLIAVNSIAAPKFSALYQRGEMEALGSVARNSAKLMVLLASPVLLLFIFFPEWILSIFGDQFKQGSTVLIILAIGQFINVATGSVGYLLMMTGNERLMRNNLLFCVILGLLLNSWLVPEYGILGAAVAAALILSTQNLIAMLLVWRELKISIFPWPNSRP